MSKIHVLSQALCNQIAAGEVLERAASAVKELIENSLDAGATAIEIELDDGGKQRLAVCDNGCGMTSEDAQLSILRHATSKLRTTEDLAAISTMGFRGEALASMAAVSKMTIITQRPEDDTGTRLHVEGAELIECRETAAPAGTQIVLEDLFYNTPARLKFLKTTATELRRVYEVIEQFGLSCPEVHFKLTFDGRIKCDWPAHKNLADRALAVFGRSLYDNLYPVQPAIMGDITVEGLFCSPEYSQSTSGRIYTYVNHRIVKDKLINSAINQAYKEFLHGKQPCVVLFLTVPLDQVDVNVHPTKHEVRFQNPDIVFKAVHRALRQSLEKTPWIRSEVLNTQASSQFFEMLPEAAFRTPEENTRRDWGLPGQYPQNPSVPSTSPSSSAGYFEQMPELSVFDRQPESPHTQAMSNDREAVENPAPHSGWDFGDMPSTGPENTGAGCGACPPPFALTAPNAAAPEYHQSPLPLEQREYHGYFSNLKYIGQHALTYLICSDGDAIVIVDQHAAHERINFERLKKVADDVLPAASQGLLFPILLNLDARLSDILNEYLEFFEKLGFQIDTLGSHAFAIRAIPECLNGYDYAAIIRDALTDLGESGHAEQFDNIKDNILATMACHSSIRAGYKMTPEEVRELFRLMDETGFRSNCPHGRPVHFVLSMPELEKRFLRTGYSGLH